MVVNLLNAKLLNHVVDAIDLETYIFCDSEEEGKKLTLDFMAAIGLTDSDIVFIEYKGIGARVRSRGYVYKPGDSYQWLSANNRGGMDND